MTQSNDPHLRAISEYFGGGMIYRGETPMFDQPLVVLVFTNRSGSNLLVDQLSTHPQIEGFGWNDQYGELLNSDEVAAIAPTLGVISFPAYLAALAGPSCARGAMFGVKASPEQLVMLLRCRIDRMFAGLRLVYTTREDTLGQAISMSIALATEQWDSTCPALPNAQPRYDFEQLSDLIAMFRQSNIYARLVMEAFGQTWHGVSYEQLTADMDATVRRVAAWLGLSSDGWTIPPPRISKQASALSDAFRAQYLSDIRNAALGLGA
jgi:LPS sulfotransferase NodH